VIWLIMAFLLFVRLITSLKKKKLYFVADPQ